MCPHVVLESWRSQDPGQKLAEEPVASRFDEGDADKETELAVGVDKAG
jgi:hypothetical protein